MTESEGRSWLDACMKGLNNALAGNEPDFYDRFVAARFVNHGTRGVGYGGIDGVRNSDAALKASFSDLQCKWEFIFAAADMVAFRYAMTGTHDGVFRGKAPTGRHFEAWGLSICRIEDGKVTEEWTAFDELHRLQQLGIIPKV